VLPAAGAEPPAPGSLVGRRPARRARGGLADTVTARDDHLAHRPQEEPVKIVVLVVIVIIVLIAIGRFSRRR
jgi:hypothetical protein